MTVLLTKCYGKKLSEIGKMMSELIEADEISILYVDDDQDARDILLSMLELRYRSERFHVAANGLQGLDMFRTLRPAIVITDISMPELDGLSMAAKIKEQSPDTIIIAVTAHSECSNLLQAIEIGINHYVLKPLSCERISSLLDHSIAAVRREQQLQARYKEITELNAALSARTRELEEANWELEAFNYTVAHDLRTPLVSISAYTQFIEHGYAAALDEKGNMCLQVIRKESKRMSDLIDALLKFSSYSRKSIVKRWADLSAIAHETMIKMQARDPQRVVNFCIAEGIQGFCDPLLLSVVIENLLGNAWKYTIEKHNACIEFGVRNKDEDLVYFVRDNGMGFEKHEEEKLFAPFHRLQCDSGIEGFGIGLATAFRIIQRHGGRIWAEGDKGHGATFSFTL